MMSAGLTSCSVGLADVPKKTLYVLFGTNPVPPMLAVCPARPEDGLTLRIGASIVNWALSESSELQRALPIGTLHTRMVYVPAGTSGTKVLIENVDDAG